MVADAGTPVKGDLGTGQRMTIGQALVGEVRLPRVRFPTACGRSKPRSTFLDGLPRPTPSTICSTTIPQYSHIH